MKYSIVYKILIFTILLMLNYPIFAQDGFDDFGGDIPIDGGLTSLLVAGLGYGAKKLRDKKKK